MYQLATFDVSKFNKFRVPVDNHKGMLHSGINVYTNPYIRLLSSRNAPIEDLIIVILRNSIGVGQEALFKHINPPVLDSHVTIEPIGVDE